MRPYFSFYNGVYGGFSDSKSGRKLSTGKLSRESPDVNYLRVFKFGSPAFLASRDKMRMGVAKLLFPRRPLCPTFFSTVSHIIRLCSDGKMRRINAGWIIAFVQYIQTLFETPIVHKERYSMGEPHVSICREHAIPLVIFYRQPLPAFPQFRGMFWKMPAFVNFFPKVFGLIWSKVDRDNEVLACFFRFIHTQLCLSLAVLEAVRASRTAFFMPESSKGVN